MILPTGSGKSLCFQLPALSLPGPTLVVVPLLALMTDMARKLSERVPAAALRGGMETGEKESLFSGLRGGKMKIVLATAEACLVPGNMRALAGCSFSHMVVDEAHCISEWGESFRPSYLRLGDIVRQIGAPLVTAFTATAAPRVTEKIRESLFGDAEVRIVSAAPDRPNISYAVEPSLCRFHTLTSLAAAAPAPLIIFVRTRKGVELAARTLRRRVPGRQIFFYHAGLSRVERRDVEAWFLSSVDGVLVSTSAYGMGVDKPDIRTVIHADVPPSIEAYLQETGRAGRDGAQSRAILLHSASDERFLGVLAAGDDRARFEAMLGYARARTGCRRARLLTLIGQEAPACSGCDVCGGNARAEAEGAAAILGFIRMNRRRFDAARAAEILAGARGPRAIRSWHDRVPGFGLLAGWKRDDVEEAVSALLARGNLRAVRRGPWAGRLVPGTMEKHTSE